MSLTFALNDLRWLGFAPLVPIWPINCGIPLLRLLSTGWLCGSPFSFHPNCTHNAIELAPRPSVQHLLPCDQLTVGVTRGHDLWTTLCKLWVRPCPNGGQAEGGMGMSDREQSERATISNHRPVWCWRESSFFSPLDSNYRLHIWPPVAMWLWLPLASPAVAGTSFCLPIPVTYCYGHYVYCFHLLVSDVVQCRYGRSGNTDAHAGKQIEVHANRQRHTYAYKNMRTQIYMQF